MTPTQKAIAIDRLVQSLSGFTALGEGYSFGVISQPENPQELTPEQRSEQTLWGITSWDTEQLGAQPTEAEFDAALFEFAKAAKIQELKSERNVTTNSDFLSSDGYLFPTDEKTIIRVQMIMQMLASQVTAENPDPIYEGFICEDNVPYDISLSEFSHALQEGAMLTMTAFATYNAKVAAVEAATTVEELVAI